MLFALAEQEQMSAADYLRTYVYIQYSERFRRARGAARSKKK